MRDRYEGPVPSFNGVFAGLDGCRSGWVLALLGSAPSDCHPVEEVTTRWPDLVFQLGFANRGAAATNQGTRAESKRPTDPQTTTGTDSPSHLTLSWHRTLAGAVAAAEQAEARGTGIDMPIGLPADGRRSADDAARAVLGHRRSTLFPTPARAVLDATDFKDALARSRAATGKGISIQAWNLMAKVREVDQWVTPGHTERVFEVHPELAFARLAGGVVLSEPKRSPAGRARRLALLAQRLGLDPAGSAELESRRPGPGMGLDDVLDAIAVACSCQRLTSGGGAVLGNGERDERGLPMRVCY